MMTMLLILIMLNLIVSDDGDDDDNNDDGFVIGVPVKQQQPTTTTITKTPNQPTNNNENNHVPTKTPHSAAFITGLMDSQMSREPTAEVSLQWIACLTVIGSQGSSLPLRYETSQPFPLVGPRHNVLFLMKYPTGHGTGPHLVGHGRSRGYRKVTLCTARGFTL